jgi:hypothetical protein
MLVEMGVRMEEWEGWWRDVYRQTRTSGWLPLYDVIVWWILLT